MKLREKLRPELDGSDASANSVAMDPSRLAFVCAQLIPLLESGDAEAIDLLEGNAVLLRAAFGLGLKPISDALGDFEFEEALTALRSAMAQREAAA